MIMFNPRDYPPYLTYIRSLRSTDYRIYQSGRIINDTTHQPLKEHYKGPEYSPYVFLKYTPRTGGDGLLRWGRTSSVRRNLDRLMIEVFTGMELPLGAEILHLDEDMWNCELSNLCLMGYERV